jgi:hypothetical protein
MVTRFEKFLHDNDVVMLGPKGFSEAFAKFVKENHKTIHPPTPKQLETLKYLRDSQILWAALTQARMEMEFKMEVKL